MKKNFYIDVCLFVILTLLMFYSFTGNFIHELLGVFALLIMIIHLVLNKMWIKSIVRKINTGKKLQGKLITSTTINIILCLSIFILIITGLIMSKSILYFLNITYSNIIVCVHKYSSYVMIVCLYIHLILHLDIITMYVCKICPLNNKKVIKTIICLLFSFILLLVIKFNFFKTSSSKKNVGNDEKINDGTNVTNDNEKNSIDDNPPTLDEYLSKLHCQGCHNRCILNSLRCNRGSSYYQQAKDDYYEEYGNNISYSGDGLYESTDGVYKLNLN